MQTLINVPVFQALAATATALGVNLLMLANLTAATRAKAKEVINPEDQEKLNPEAAVVYEGGNERTARYRRAHRNALENIPLFLVTGLILAFTPVPATLAFVLFGSFVGARLLHSILYVRAVQPFRTAMFAMGMLAQLAVLGCVVFYGFFV